MALHHKFKHIYHRHHILRIHPHQSTKSHLDNQVAFLSRNHQSTQVKIKIILRLTIYLKITFILDFAPPPGYEQTMNLPPAGYWRREILQIVFCFRKIIEHKQYFIECIYNFIYIMEVPGISWYLSIGFLPTCMYFQFEKPNQISPFFFRVPWDQIQPMFFKRSI